MRAVIKGVTFLDGAGILRCPKKEGVPKDALFSRSDLLRESDAPQNGNGLFYEFSFGIAAGRKGQKHVLLEEECAKLHRARLRPSRESLLLAAHARAVEIRRRLESTPGLTRSAIARELGVNRARVTQILRRFKN